MRRTRQLRMQIHRSHPISEDSKMSSESTQSLAFGVKLEPAPHHCGLHPELVKFSLVALSGLGRVVRHEEQTLA